MKFRGGAWPERTWLIAVSSVALSLIAGAFVVSTYISDSRPSLFCTKPLRAATTAGDDFRLSLLHYATSSAVPQQSLAEISITLDVLRSRSPCNFLVFGLGRDSLMWHSFNPNGTTLFLEEDKEWLKSVTGSSPIHINARTVRYTTRLDQADQLISRYKSEPMCSPANAYLKDNRRCRLALANLPEEVYETEWDLIMIDAPRGYFAAAPGRMAAIFSAAVMARNRRRGTGPTHVFLHDVDRRVEKMFAVEFLCDKFRVGGVGRLWHFVIPPMADRADGDGAGGGSAGFCG